MVLLKVNQVSIATDYVITLWEGDQPIDWNADLLKITAEQMADIPTGAEIHIYYTTPEADYHAMRITSPSWGDNAEDQVVAQFDLTEETPNHERGGMLIVGYGYRLTKVTTSK